MFKRNVFFTFCLLVFTLLLAKNANSQLRNIELQAAGLTCSLCSNAILKALKPLPFIEEIKTDVANSTFLITTRAGVPVNLDQLSRKVEGAGFSVGKLSVEVNFDKIQVKNDTHTSVSNFVFHFLNIAPQAINGWQKVRVIDKNFLLANEVKKYSKLTTLACYKTGFTAACCNSTAATPQRVYHVTL